MSATSPAQAIQQFSQHLNDGDIEGALALYEPDATFVPQPGQAIYGLDAIRSALTGFVALRPTMTGEIHKVLEAKERRRPAPPGRWHVARAHRRPLGCVVGWTFEPRVACSLPDASPRYEGR
jgi:hypothetical protein